MLISFLLLSYFNGLYPDCVAVNMVEYHLILVAATGDMREFSSLVSVDCMFATFCLFLIERLLHILDFDEDIAFLL